MRNRRENHLWDVVLLVLFLLPWCACAPTSSSVKPESSMPSKSSDAAADAVLGALPAEEKPEAEKQAENLTGNQKRREALQDHEEEKKEDDLERLHRNITDPNQ